MLKGKNFHFRKHSVMLMNSILKLFSSWYTHTRVPHTQPYIVAYNTHTEQTI